MPGDTLLSEFKGIKLFGRALSLVISSPDIPLPLVDGKFNADPNGIDVSGLDVDFHVEKSLKPEEPNTLRLRIYNLAETTRQSLSGKNALTVRLEAGYLGATAQLYLAQTRAAWTKADGSEYETHIESMDTVARPTGIKRSKKPVPGSKTGSIYVSKGPKVPIQQAFQSIADVLGIGVGNLNAALAGRPNQALQSVSGSALLGNGAQRMTDLCRSAGLEWSIQDGQLQLLNIGGILSTNAAIRIASDSGMIGSPSVDSQGAVSVKSLLIPGLAPGVLISLDTLFCKGGYRIDKIRYIGSTYGEAWWAEMDAIKY
jgi:hypothetical protein